MNSRRILLIFMVFVLLGTYSYAEDEKLIPLLDILREQSFEVSSGEGSDLIITKEDIQWTIKTEEELLRYNSEGLDQELPLRLKKLGDRFYTSSEYLSHFLIKEEDISYQEEITILMYHHLLKEKDMKGKFKDNLAVISQENFSKQMKTLKDLEYTTISLEELENFVGAKINIPNNSILITFDDGYKSNYIYAYPILKKYGFKAANFLITNLVEYEEEPFDPNHIQFLSWKEIESSRDVFEFAGHTHDLHRLTPENISKLTIERRKSLLKDLKINKELLNTRYFAYPYGQYTYRIQDALKEVGFGIGLTTNNGIVKSGDNPMLLNRIGIHPNTSEKSFIKILKPKEK